MTIQLPDHDQRMAITGPAERNLKIIREALGVSLTARNGSLRLTGETRAVGQAAVVLERLQEAGRANKPMSREQLLETVSTAALTNPSPAGPTVNVPPSTPETMEVYLPGKRIRAKTPGQMAYLEALHNHDLTFCIGPAGTGKTYLAVAAAVSMLKSGQVRKLVLVRPAVEAGEKLGFLPGTMQDKVNPYLRPLLDALHDMMEFEHIERFMAHD
ncbi:MAG: PhoH family protein, partial [Planctomycetota bacterium]